MTPSPQLAALVAQMPDPDAQGMYCTGIDKQKIEAAIAEIHQGGRENILGLIEMLVEPGKGDDVKPHYGLHCLANHVCSLGDAEAKRQFTEALASQLGGERPKVVQAYLCQQLQWAGGQEAVRALGKLLTDEELCEPAAAALVATVRGAAEQFRAALPNARGKCRLAIIQNLGVLADAEAIADLRAALGDADREIRIAAAWGLANLGDVDSVDLLLKAADAEGWERIQHTNACLLLAERLTARIKNAAATKIYTHLKNTRTDPSERYIREAAEEALSHVT
jgi:hypothetical protein